MKKIDLCMVFVGRPGCGKTTRARSTAAALARVRPVLVHDPACEWTGRVTSSTPTTPGIYVDRRASADEIVARLVAERQPLLARGIRPHEIALVLDEGSAWGGERRHTPSPATLTLLAQRRHLGVGLIVLVQYASLAPRALWDTATAACVFRTAPRDLRCLVDRGMPPDAAERAHEQAVGEYVFHAF